MKSVVALFPCEVCPSRFNNVRDLKLHLAKAHQLLKVVCVWCYDRERCFRGPAELKTHVKSRHLSETKGLPGDFLGESNSFWLSQHPDQVVRVNSPTGWSSKMAREARQLVLEWVRRCSAPSRSATEWEDGWKILKEDGYQPEQPAMETLELHSIELSSGGGTAFVFSREQWLKVELEPAILSDLRSLSSLTRRMGVLPRQPQFPVPTDGWVSPTTHEVKEKRVRAARILDVSVTLIKDIFKQPRVTICAVPVPTKRRRLNSDLSDIGQDPCITLEYPVTVTSNTTVPPTFEPALISPSPSTFLPLAATLCGIETTSAECRQQSPSPSLPVAVSICETMTSHDELPSPSPSLRVAVSLSDVGTSCTISSPLVSIPSPSLPVASLCDVDTTCTASALPVPLPSPISAPPCVETLRSLPQPISPFPASPMPVPVCGIEIPQPAFQLPSPSLHSSPPSSTSTHGSSKPVSSSQSTSSTLTTTLQSTTLLSLLPTTSDWTDVEVVSSADTNIKSKKKGIQPFLGGPLSFPSSVTTVSERAVKLLRLGCMPVFPPGRRNWDTKSVSLVVGSVTVVWPPKQWTVLTPDQRLMAWEFAVMKLAAAGNRNELPIVDRGVLMDRYNFLALPGTANIRLPESTTSQWKGRYYTYETLRQIATGQSSGMKNWLCILEAGAVHRETSLDHLIKTVDRVVPLRLDA